MGADGGAQTAKICCSTRMLKTKQLRTPVMYMHGTFTYDSHFSNSETCKCENFTVINKQD